MSSDTQPKSTEMLPGMLRMPDGLGENRPGEALPIAPFIRALVEELDRKEIEWAILRNAEDLPDFTRYDLDVLTHPPHLAAFTAAAESCAQKNGGRIVGRIRKYGYTCLMLVFERPGQEPCYLPLDVFTALEFRGCRYLDVGAVLQRRVLTPRGVWAVPSGVSAAIALLKEWLPHGTLNERKRQSVQALALASPDTFAATMRSAAGAEWGERILRDDWRLSPLERKSLRRAVRRRHPGWVMAWFRAAWANLIHLFRPSLGLVVCLAGADGSGKTTLAQQLAERTFKRPFKGCRYLHGNIGVLPRFRDMRSALSRLLRLPCPAADRESSPEPARLQGMMDPVPAWKSVLLASYYALDFFLARLLIRRWRGQWLLVLMDRSFYDYTYQRGHRNCPGWVLRLLSWIVPKPDLLFWIEGDAEKIHARKPELTVDEIRIEQEILRDMSARLPFACRVDGGTGIEAMAEAGERAIRRKLSGAPAFHYLGWAGRPLAACSRSAGRMARVRSWRLFPCTSAKRSVLRGSLCCLASVGLDRLLFSRGIPAAETVSGEEILTLLNQLKEFCSGKDPDWLLTWPAQPERRRTYLVFRAPSNGLSGVVKIGRGTFNRRQLHNEAAVLRSLAPEPLPFLIPSVLFLSDPCPGSTALALGNFPDRPRRVASRDASRIGRSCVERFKQMPARCLPLETTDWFQLIDKPLRRSPDSSNIDLGFAHGDLGPANMLRAASKKAFVLDWENASDQAPVLTDPVGLWLSTRQARALRSPGQVLRALQQDFAQESGTELVAALLFLCAHGNLSAARVLEIWERPSGC